MTRKRKTPPIRSMVSDMKRGLRMLRASALGIQCADAAIAAGGPDPFDADGRCLLPLDPLPGDWTTAADEMGGQLTPDESANFERQYRIVMQKARTAFEASRKNKGEVVP